MLAYLKRLGAWLKGFPVPFGGGGPTPPTKPK